jgi:phage-related protein
VIGAVLGMIARFTDIGKQIIDGFIDGITSGFDRVKDLLGKLTDKLPDWKGPASRDRTLLKDSGRLIMSGLIAGIRSQESALKRTLTGVSGLIQGGIAATPTVALAGTVAVSPTALKGGATTYNVHVSVPPTVDSAEVGRQVVRAIEAHERQTGRTRLVRA